MLETITDLYDKHIVLAGDFNFFFDTSLDSYRGKPTLKNKSIAKFIELKEKFDLCDIWRIRNPKTKIFTFRQKHDSGLIQRRLDYLYISNSMQVSVENTDVLASLLTDHSPVTFSCFKNEESNRGRGLWKLNNSLIENVEYVLQMKKFIFDTLNELFNENILDDQVKWEYLKYNISKYTINFSKELAKNTNKTTADLETKLRHYEKHENHVYNIDYKVCKQLSYNKNLEQDKKFFEHILKIESILKLWCMRLLTLEGRITVFKSLAISKVIHLLLITKIRNNTIDFMYKIQKKFIWQGKKTQIKHGTLCNEY